jgi:toxin CptA
MTSSDAFSPCRLEWRPSRWLPAALCVLAVAAIAALWMSSLPLLASGIGSAFVLAYASWLLRRESHRPFCMLSWPGGDADWQVECEGRVESWRHVDASVRGGIAVLTLVDANGKPRRYIWWPDILDARSRRALRLALSSREKAARSAAAPDRRAQ